MLTILSELESIPGQQNPWIFFFTFLHPKMPFMHPGKHVFCPHFYSVSSQKNSICHTELSFNIVELWTRVFNYSLQKWIFCCLLGYLLEFLVKLQWNSLLGIYTFMVHEMVHQLGLCTIFPCTLIQIILLQTSHSEWVQVSHSDFFYLLWIMVGYHYFMKSLNSKSQATLFDQTISALRFCPFPWRYRLSVIIH